MGRIMSVGIAVSVLLSGCGGDSGPVAPPPPPPAAVVTTVEVAVAAGTLLPGDTTVATATVKDQNGTVMTGQTVTWASSDAAATVSASGVVIAAGTGNATISASAGGRTGSAPVAVVRDDRFGYIWNSSLSTSYTVENGYEFLSSGSKATVSYAAVGQYTVTLPGLGAGAGQRTNVQISGYGSGSNYCKAGGWQTSGADLVIEVRCFDTAGNPADALFTLLAVGGTALDGRLGFALANDEAATAAYAPQQARSSRAGAVAIARAGSGRYAATFHGLKRGGIDGPDQVFVTAVGTGGERCWVQGWTFGTFATEIRCANAAGALADTKFSLLILEKGRSTAKAAFAWADQASTAAYAPNPSYRYNSTGGANQVARSATGTYSVTFPGLTRTAGASETIIVTAYGESDRRCRIGSWSTGTSVSIFCYDTAGNLVDSEFDILTIQ